METDSQSNLDLLGGSDVSGSLQQAIDFFITFGTDFLAFIVVACLVAAFAFYFGRDRLLALIAALYAAIPLFQTFPYSSLLPNNAYVEIGLFAGFFLVGLLGFSGLSTFLARSSSSFLGTGVLSILSAGLVLAISIHVLPVQEIYTFSAPTLALFASGEAFFLWLLAPLLGLFFFGR